MKILDQSQTKWNTGPKAEYWTCFFLISPPSPHVFCQFFSPCLQNNCKITILTFKNVKGVLAFSQLLFWRKPAGFSDSFCWQQQIYTWFSSRIWEDVFLHVSHCHMPLKTHKNVTEQLWSNTVSAQIFLAHWTRAAWYIVSASISRCAHPRLSRRRMCDV